jgi:hypothetical protein
MWYAFVDTVSYITSLAYINEGVKYLPQAIEGVKKESILILLDNIKRIGIIDEKELDDYENKISCRYITNQDTRLNKEDFAF